MLFVIDFVRADLLLIIKMMVFFFSCESLQVVLCLTSNLMSTVNAGAL